LQGTGPKDGLKVIVSCADESGTDLSGPTPYASLAGFLGPSAAWKRFHSSWKRVLNEFGIGEFHMTEWLSGKSGAYRGWDKSRRLSLVGQLVEAINAHNLRGFALQVSFDDYKRLGHSEPPYLVLFDAALTTLKTIMDEEILTEEHLFPYFGRTSSLESRSKRLYNYRLANDEVMRNRFYTAEPHFLSPSEMIGLQPADLLASVARNYVRGVVNPELNTFLAWRNLRQIIGYNRTTFRVMAENEIGQSVGHVKASARA
jgi:Protein of unknown function (DUF3800)